MRATLLHEAGLEPALFGLGLNKGRTSNDTYLNAQKESEMIVVARKLAAMDGGHNKFLEAIMLWIDVSAPRYWWQQFDTYRVGVTKQSESTMNTLLKNPISKFSFIADIPQETIARLEHLRQMKAFDKLKNELPEGFIQRRVVCLSYKALRNMVAQRNNHRLEEWKSFFHQVLTGIAHPEFFSDLKGVNTEE